MAVTRLTVIESDILAIAGANSVGLRHISSKEALEKEATEGVKSGCALNLSFHPGKNSYRVKEGELDPAKFKYLDKKVAEKDSTAAILIDAYAQAVFNFICTDSVGCDACALTGRGTISIKTVVEDAGSHFMLVFPRAKNPRDVNRCGGLGRFPKAYHPPERVLPIRTPTRSDFEGLDYKAEKSDIRGVIRLVAEKHFDKVVETIRSPEFAAKCTAFPADPEGK
ncbi:MAG: hypothetical protein SP1CHLAM54_14600 [Chlamydiia bacterium]|nr:hypothetical protein [Chlamydiia bacterium]MCH9616351.1 hypothetical protein [Chlamydiia bacterium]MCH9629663.1 hypothetical protein [Chlamydiia bacterium]